MSEQTKKTILEKYEDKIYRAENWEADDLVEKLILELLEIGAIPSHCNTPLSQTKTKIKWRSNE